MSAKNNLIHVVFTLGIVSTWLWSCQTGTGDNRRVMKPVDTTITAQTAFINLFLDSNLVYDFIKREKLNANDSIGILSFYHDRNFQYAWFDTAGMAEQAGNFINLYRNYRESVGDSTLFVPAFDTLMNKWLSDSVFTRFSLTDTIETELLLTRHFFRYAEKAYAGRADIDPADLGWFIPRRKLDARLFLDSAIVSGGKDLAAQVPVHPMFEALRQQLALYTRLTSQHPFDSIRFSKPKYMRGDSAPEIALLKQRLHWLGDMPAGDSTPFFNEAAAAAVANFQKRMGLTPDSVPGKSFFEAINVPMAQRIRQLRINLERARWVPKPGNGRYIVVNIPGFTLNAYDSGRSVLQMPVVVGKPATNTVIFTGEMKYVVFAPYWNVPYSIVKNEMGRSAAYFSKRNMEIVGRYADGLPMVRQRPGPKNSLGRVKFLFPNSYSIYLHDTPSRNLFGEQKRAFSHGCIRVGDPEALANWVLSRQPEWTSEKIKEAMNGKAEKTITVSQPISVFIGYFTSWVSDDGKLNFRSDLYGHDKKMAERLFGSGK